MTKYHQLFTDNIPLFLDLNGKIHIQGTGTNRFSFILTMMCNGNICMENLFNLVTLARVYFKDRWLIYGVAQTNEKGTHNYIIKKIYKEENN